MSGWSTRNGTSSPVAGASGTRQFNDGGVGLPSGVGGVYHPTVSGQPGSNTTTAGNKATDGDSLPGVVSINPLDPAATKLDPIGELFNGLRQATVGRNENRDQPGFKDKSLIGGVPILGDVGRGAANLLGGAGEVFGVITGAIGGGLERVPTIAGAPLGIGGAQFAQDPTTGETITTDEYLNREYAKLPEEFRKQYDEAINKEHGLFGTGLLDNDAHFKSVALREYAKEQQYKNPSLNPGAFTAPGSLADSITNMMDVLDASPAVVAKHWAQLDSAGGPDQGLDRVEMILAVGNEERKFEEDKGLLGTGILSGDPTTGLNPLEELVYVKVTKGDWTREQALDFLASNGQAYGHAALSNIGGSLILDPLNLATFGAGIVAKVGAKGATMVARLAAAEAKFAEVAKALEEAQAAVRVARVGGKGAENLSTARKVLRGAQEEFDAAQASAKAFRAYHSGGQSIGRLNVIAKAVEGSEKVGKAFLLAGRGYAALEGTSIGRAAKITRTLIDPLHAVDLHMPGAARVADVYSDAVPRNVVDTLGVHHYKGMLDDALKLDHTRGMYDQLTRDIAVASTNMAREAVVDMYRSTHMAAQLGEDLMKTLPDDVMETAIQSTKQRDLEKWLRYNSLKHILVERWTPAAEKTLANQLEQVYHTRTADEWLEAFKTMSKEQKSLYKFAAYGATNRALLDYVAQLAPEVAAKFPTSPGRMVLLAKGTLSRLGGEALLTKLTKTKSLKKKLDMIREAQDLYPALRYISIDPANLERSVDQFVEYLKQNMDRLPMQMTEDEVKALGSDADNLKSLLGEYSIGFRPDDRFLWGLEREAGTGLYKTATAAWADHVADGAIAYRPAAAIRMNIAGHPLVDVPLAGKVLKAVDTMDSAARLMKTQVSAAMVFEAARKRFLAKAVENLGEHGVTERVAQDWFERITEYTREHPGYSGPRGLSGGELYKAIREKNLIPQPLVNGAMKFTENDILRLVLEAYDGDMRLIGLTQKLSGRVKKMVSAATGYETNFAGQIAEHAWPLLKFRYNPIFQLQEKVEPWVLNAQRGVSFAFGATDMTEADRMTERLLQRMTDNSLVRQSDLDQFEYSSQVLFGKAAARTAAKPGSVMNRIQSVGKQVAEVQGMKRLNMLRTFRKGLGKELKAAWEEARPGDWDKMKEAADLRAGRILDEDDFALQIVSENAYANDVFVKNVVDKAGKFTGQKTADWGNAIKTGAWHTPTTLGELKALDLDHVAESLRITNRAGAEITDLNGLRQALATEPDVMDKVVDGLTRLGADKDYIRRVQHALDFSWTGFWKTAEKRFGLTADESFQLQAMMAQAAQLRGMTPVDFMSQVFSPSIIDGTEGVLGHMEGPVRILREARAAGRKISPREAKLAETRTKLAGKEGVSTREDLVRQLSRTFSAHLDPSAKRALLMEFKPELRQLVADGKVQLDWNEVSAMWDDMADNELADRILGYMDGKVGTHPHDVVDDANRGVQGVRDAATRYMQDRGVTPQAERRYYQPDEDLSKRTADAYRDLPETPFEKTGRKPTIKQVQNASTELKPRPDTVDERTYAAYQDLVIETRAQWDYMTKPKAKGGLGLKVIIARGDPYPNSAAMRADVARGQIRVFAGSSDHPLMTNEQNVMFRAVHDVFGHAAEGFEFGPRGELNAAIKHSQMYSDTARPAMLTETHGQNSYVNFSDDPYVPDAPNVANAPATRVQLDPADPIGSFEQLHGARLYDETAAADVAAGADATVTPNSIEFRGKDAYGHEYTLNYQYTNRLGEGIRGLPADQQALVLQPLSDLLQEFPNLKVFHFDMVPFSDPLLTDAKGALTGMGFDDAGGLTWGGSENPVIILNQDVLWKTGKGFTPDTDIHAHQYWAGSRNRTQSWDSFSKKWIDKRSHLNAPEMARPYTIGYIVRHETGHAFDSMRRPRVWDPVTHSWSKAKAAPGYEDYHAMMDRFERLGANLDLSEYGMSNSAEFGAELFAFATDPRYNADAIAEPALRDMAEEYRQYLFDSGEWKPTNPPTPPTGPTPPPSAGPGVNPARLQAAAKEVLTVTDNIEGAHFMLPDGTLVRGRGEHWEAAEKLGGESKVRQAGFIRISGSSRDHLNFDISQPLTSEQWSAMKDAAATRQTVTIDLHEGRWFGDGTDYVSNGEGFGHETWSNERVINTARERMKQIDAERRATFGEPGPAPTGGTPPTPPVEPTTPKTVAEANKAKPGSVYAKQKAALLPQDLLDEFGTKFVGRGKHVESNPDVARTAQYFGKWSEAVVYNGLLRGEHSVYGGLLHDIAGIPTKAAVPYNYTEGAAVNLATQAMVRKWDDAFRLQYFSQERSFAERSLNHPMFGMYPASYMWGKIMPEMVRFLAFEPFGQKTGGLLYSAMDVQAAIALRREYDPYFDAKIEELGHSQALSFGGYMLPTLPWDISASAPAWMRSVAQHGTSNAGKAPNKQEDISLIDPAVESLKKLVPLTTTLPWAGRAADELNPFKETTPQQEAKDARDMNKAVKAAELQPTMQRVMKELQEALR